nr:hypothetical protein [Tanacetum cinerariifolium]
MCSAQLLSARPAMLHE